MPSKTPIGLYLLAVLGVISFPSMIWLFWNLDVGWDITVLQSLIIGVGGVVLLISFFIAHHLNHERWSYWRRLDELRKEQWTAMQDAMQDAVRETREDARVWKLNYHAQHQLLLDVLRMTNQSAKWLEQQTRKLPPLD
jgi:hypothetical protein